MDSKGGTRRFTHLLVWIRAHLLTTFARGRLLPNYDHSVDKRLQAYRFDQVPSLISALICAQVRSVKTTVPPMTFPASTGRKNRVKAGPISSSF